MDGAFFMVNWVEVTADEDIIIWDELLLTAKDYSIFQSIAWGEFKKSANWQPIRYWIRNKNGDVLAMVQLLVKKLPLGINMLWAPGGPVFQFPSSNAKNLNEQINGLVETIKDRYTHYLVRFNSFVSNTASLSYNINKVCLRPIYNLGSGYTILLDLDTSGDEFRSQMTSKHRYYVKKASSSLLTWTVGNNIEYIKELAIVYQEMMRDKNISNIATNYDGFLLLRKALKENILVLTGYLNGVPVTSCLILIFGQKSYYLYAATRKEGRPVSASYAMFEQLAQELKRRNATLFDFGCIDPESSSAAGVDHFKGGFGGDIHQYLGEWETASSSLLRSGLNTVMKFRSGKV